MPALADVLQPAIDAVLAQGVNKVVLLSHLQQIDLETELAGLLTGVDVIVAGGSDTILANPDDVLQPGDVAADSYPRLASSDSDEPVAIVSTDGEYSYVGRLVVDFDATGVLVAPDGTPLESWTELDAGLNGPVLTTPESAAAVWGGGDPFAPGTKGRLVRELVNSVTGVVIAKDSEIYGETTVFIDGRRSEVRTQETTAGNLSADANLYTARQFDPGVQVSIKNGGGIRAEIGEVVNDGDQTLLLPPQENPLSGKQEGEISRLDIENSLRFNNALTVLTTTAAGLKELMEHAVAATAPGATPGQFPQIGGMAFAFDPTRPARTIDAATGLQTLSGERIRSLVVGEGAGTDVVVLDGVVQGDPMRPIRVVTLSFLADPPPANPASPNGGDNYPFPGVTTPGSKVNLTPTNLPPGDATFANAGSEQDAFAEYLIAFHGQDAGTPFNTPDTPMSDDLRIQNLDARTDATEDSVIRGTDGGNRINGTTSDDIILGMGGNDRLDGKSGNDYLVGGMGNDELRGGNGDDVLIGNEGNDTYFGGGGRDRMVFVGGGTDTVTAFELTNDTLDFQGAFADAAEFTAAASFRRGATVIQVPGGGTVTLQGRKPGDLVPGVNVSL
jgi:Ca2+-binding RTX toxin-like protein